MPEHDNAIAAVINFFRTPPPVPYPEVSVEQLRALWDSSSVIMNRGAPDRPVQRGVAIGERDGRVITADVYPADGPAPHPAILYIHGGAWTLGSPATHHKLTCRFAEAGFTTVSVDYALAPEHPYPAGLEDCLVAAGWMCDHVAEVGGDPERLGISGDSAGGNLAASVLAAQLERSGATPFRAAALLYGVYDWALMQRLPRDIPFANFDSTARDVGHYLGGDESLFTRPSVSPACSPDLASFPPTQLIAGTQDPLLMQSQVFAADLQQAGVDVDLRVYEGVPHAFLQIEELPETGKARADLFAFLTRRLAPAASEAGPAR